MSRIPTPAEIVEGSGNLARRTVDLIKDLTTGDATDRAGMKWYAPFAALLLAAGAHSILRRGRRDERLPAFVLLVLMTSLLGANLWWSLIGPGLP